jgi:hypothetical protein
MHTDVSNNRQKNVPNRQNLHILTESIRKSLLQSVFCIASSHVVVPPLRPVMKSTRPDQTKRDVKLHLHRSTFTCARSLLLPKGWEAWRWGRGIRYGCLISWRGSVNIRGGRAEAGDGYERIRDDWSGEKEKERSPVSGGCRDEGKGMKNKFKKRK